MTDYKKRINRKRNTLFEDMDLLEGFVSNCILDLEDPEVSGLSHPSFKRNLARENISKIKTSVSKVVERNRFKSLGHSFTSPADESLKNYLTHAYIPSKIVGEGS